MALGGKGPHSAPCGTMYAAPLTFFGADAFISGTVGRVLVLHPPSLRFHVCSPSSPHFLWDYRNSLWFRPLVSSYR